MNSNNNTVNKRTALLIATLSSFLTPFMGSSVNIALPSIGKELALDAVLLRACEFILSGRPGA